MPPSISKYQFTLNLHIYFTDQELHYPKMKLNLLSLLTLALFSTNALSCAVKGNSCQSRGGDKACECNSGDLVSKTTVRRYYLAITLRLSFGYPAFTLRLPCVYLAVTLQSLCGVSVLITVFSQLQCQDVSGNPNVPIYKWRKFKTCPVPPGGGLQCVNGHCA